jgi:hypothetical protein
MNASLHNTDSNSATVKTFKKDNTDIFSKDFAVVSVQDSDRNEVALFFSNLAEVLNFAKMIEEQAHNLAK